MGSTPIASTTRNAVEPAESSVQPPDSAGFLFSFTLPCYRWLLQSLQRLWQMAYGGLHKPAAHFDHPGDL